MHHHTELFIRRWISTGFTPSLLKKPMTERCSSLVHVTRGPPSLHYYCPVVLHSCIVLPPVCHSSNHEYYCCQLTRQSSCVSYFYRTFKIFIWLSLIYIYIYSGHYFHCPVHARKPAELNTKIALYPSVFLYWNADKRRTMRDCVVYVAAKDIRLVFESGQ